MPTRAQLLHGSEATLKEDVAEDLISSSKAERKDGNDATQREERQEPSPKKKLSQESMKIGMTFRSGLSHT